MAAPSETPYDSMPIVEGVRVDVDALLSLAHHCDPMCCRHMEHCCMAFEVEVEEHELERAIGMMKEAARYQPGLFENGVPIDPSDDAETGLCLATHENGLCVFAYYTPEGMSRCSLHSAALDLGLRPEDVKPGPCSLWPLAIVDELNPPVLTVQENVDEFPCNSMRKRRTLNPDVADIIRNRYGETFLNELQSVVAERAPA